MIGLLAVRTLNPRRNKVRQGFIYFIVLGTCINVSQKYMVSTYEKYHKAGIANARINYYKAKRFDIGYCQYERG